MTSNDQTCTNCLKTGLAILPLRYAVLPRKVKAVMPAGIRGARVTDVALDAHHYGLRTLREGWVYLFYETGPRGNRYWETYKVTPDGRLWKQTLPLPRMPITHPACAQRAIAVPMDVIAIERPGKCTGRVFVAFSEHAWHTDVFDRYASDTTLMQTRMQCIEPFKWITGGTDTNGHAVVATAAAIDQVIEYMPGLDPRLLALPDEKQPFSDEKGNYRDDFLKHEVTRYPTFIRQASPASASQALVKLMAQIGADPDDPGWNYAPMMLALWDGIGNVHELNGYRGDPAAWFDLYVSKERTLQVGALCDIDTAHTIVQLRVDQRESNRYAMEQQAHAMTPLPQPEAQRALAIQRTRALASANPMRAAQINAYYDDMSWMSANNIHAGYQRRVVQLAESTSAASANSRVLYTSARRDQLMGEIRSYALAQPGAHDRELAAMRHQKWERYEARLVRPDVERFRKNYKALQSAVFDLQESRSADVGRWLQAKLFLDTLEDYQSPDLLDAVAFELVITDGLAGLGSTPKGKAVIDALVTQWDPTLPGSLIWRVIAMNRKDARQELGKLLKTALAKKNMPLAPTLGQLDAGNSPGVEAVILAAATASKLNNAYKDITKLALETDPKKISPLGEMVKRLKVDRFLLSVGDSIFFNFKADQLGDFVGEKVIQSVLLQRAGVSHADAMALVRHQAKLESLSRQETIERLLKERRLLRTGAPGNAARATQTLHEVWNAMASTNDGIKASTLNRIAVVAALLEAVNFYKLLSSAPDRDTRMNLAKASASMLSALITITMTPYFGALKNSVRSQSWKLVGSGLSSFGTFITAWMDAEKVFDSYHKRDINSFGIYASKAVMGLASSAAILIDAASTAAPVLQKLAKRYGTRVVIEVVETVSKRVIAVAALRVIGMLAGWEATLLLFGLQLMADCLTPDELESWCSRCAFGTAQETTLRITNHSVTPYTEPSQQEKDFVNAMTNLS